MASSEISTVKTIAQLNDEARNFILVAVVIAKSNPRFFSGHAKNRDFSEQDSSGNTGIETARGVLTLTLRDSVRDTINCTVWGKADTIAHYDNAFEIGDVIDVNRPQVSSSVFGRAEQYSPTVTSPYCLTVSDQRQVAQIVRHEGSQDTARLQALLRVPLVQPSSTIPLADIVASGSGCNGETFNLLVIVRAVRAKRDIRVARSNEVKSLREVVLMDSSHTGVVMKFWSESYIRWSDRWTPLKTVLLIVDARVEFSEYYKTICLAVDRKTIITQDPNLPQLNNLLAHAKSIPTQDIDVVCSLSSGSVDPTINAVMTVQQILDRTEGDLVQEQDQFTALCYAVITRLDLDGTTRNVSERCVNCRTLVRGQDAACPKNDCPGYLTAAGGARESFFDLTIDITDHTGTLAGCRMVSRVAETVLECDVASFKRQSDDQKTHLKWKFLLDRCAVKLIVKRRSAVRFQNLYSIVDCAIADPAEVEEKLKVY